jgi:hypothetical protein
LKQFSRKDSEYDNKEFNPIQNQKDREILNEEINSNNNSNNNSIKKNL